MGWSRLAQAMAGAVRRHSRSKGPHTFLQGSQGQARRMLLAGGLRIPN
jgi:hypothetical protein